MKTQWTFLTSLFKPLLVIAILCTALFVLSSCTVNPATGQQQFTALMPQQQESRIGADEHQKIMKTFGQPNPSDPAQLYVEKLGQAVSARTERPEVTYRFFLLDTPMVNAFALPGGYVYVSRGLLALANSEAELAAVLAHEVGHITARHSAERYSRGLLTSLGASVVAAAIDNKEVARAAGLGSALYIKSYSRSQEHQADELGIRYLHRAGYDHFAMARFLEALESNTAFERVLAGHGEAQPFNYFSTHPQTADRIVQAVNTAGRYEQGKGRVGRESYLKTVDGVVYGDSARQGFVRGQNFYHTKMDFTFSVPDGFQLQNQPSQVVATSKSGAVVLFDAAGNRNRLDAMTYLTKVWMREEPLDSVEEITINGMKAATASFTGTVNKAPVTIRVIAVAWAPDSFFRFQMAIPNNAGAAVIEGLKRTTYSMRHLTEAEKKDIRPWRLRIVTAKTGDSVDSLARSQPFETAKEDHFRVLNGLKPGEGIVSGQKYKRVSVR